MSVKTEPIAAPPDGLPRLQRKAPPLAKATAAKSLPAPTKASAKKTCVNSHLHTAQYKVPEKTKKDLDRFGNNFRNAPQEVKDWYSTQCQKFPKGHPEREEAWDAIYAIKRKDYEPLKVKNGFAIMKQTGTSTLAKSCCFQAGNDRSIFPIQPFVF